MYKTGWRCWQILYWLPGYKGKSNRPKKQAASNGRDSLLKKAE
jgi:hypothetical protein